MKERLFNHGSNKWLAVSPSNASELEEIFLEYEIDEEVIQYSLDKNERAHLSYDKLSKVFVLIYNIPNQTKIDNRYETVPVTFIIKSSTLITVTSEASDYIVAEMEKFITKNEEISCGEFLFSSLFLASDHFFPYIDEISKEIKVVTGKLNIKTTKNNLLLLSDLEMSILVFVSAARQNEVVLAQTKQHPIYKQFTEEEKEELDDAIIEAKQLVEMTQLSSNMLEQLSRTHNNILNNNLNETMRVLTVLSVLLTIPTIITGFFGMNMPLPLENNVFGWVITIGISLILWFLLSFILKKIMK